MTNVAQALAHNGRPAGSWVELKGATGACGVREGERVSRVGLEGRLRRTVPRVHPSSSSASPARGLDFYGLLYLWVSQTSRLDV